MLKKGFAIFVSATALGCAPALACGDGPGGFQNWLGGFKSKAISSGISSKTVNAALSGVNYDAKVIRLDRGAGQHSFKQSFDQFYARRVSGSMIARGRQLLQSRAGELGQIEKKYGVPGAVVVAIWGLETNYGSQRGGGFSILQSLATLAYDCRRSDFFEKQLIGALKIVDRGDMSVSQLRGGWAGEIGQTQFLPDAYVKYAVDFDGDGRRDLVHSPSDVLASTASYLKAHGWQRGAGFGPGSGNYDVIREWNKAEVYVKTISVMAAKLQGG